MNTLSLHLTNITVYIMQSNLDIDPKKIIKVQYESGTSIKPEAFTRTHYYSGLVK